jgi:retinol dehydrogenase-12
MSENNKPLEGKICMVTGATSGIGAVTARALAQKGARVIIVARNVNRCENTVAEIIQTTGNHAVEYMLADLSSQDEIHNLVRVYQDKYERLDVLVNNAGGFFMSRLESIDGIEMTFALNHLNYFLLTNLLIETIKASAPARIVNVSSAAHQNASIDFDDLQDKHNYSSWQAYGQSKLANILFTYELARRLEGTGVTVNALHPGFVATNFGANNAGFLGTLVRRFMNLFSIDVETGAQTSIYLAASAEVEGVTGKYFVKQQAVASSEISYDQTTAKRLWEISEEMTGVRESA